jgi:enoyl-CoA hydratase/carnithine racemase
MEIAACCDIRICGESSRFGVPIKRLGLTMAAKELEALLKVTNYSIAMEILLEGRIMDAKEAYEKNLVNRVVPDHSVETEAYKAAELICDGAPKVARWHKEFAKEIISKGKVTSALNNKGYKCYDTEDFQIGYKSFLTKTKPKFKNK